MMQKQWKIILFPGVIVLIFFFVAIIFVRKTSPEPFKKRQKTKTYTSGVYNAFPFFQKNRISIEAAPSQSGLDTQRAIDAVTGFEQWKYIVRKGDAEIEVGNFYSVRGDGTTETNAQAFNTLIQEEAIDLDEEEAQRFADMVLRLSFNSVYDGGEVQEVVKENDIFHVVARLKQIVGMVPYHKESTLTFSFTKNGTLGLFVQGPWKTVEGHE
ncbi:hypothetical protein HY624_04040 [Candidatus Uhrbacteria bacterium]|nr:hypothetical protein [Candidatus Uhrbacteria bacterium]